MFSTLNSFSVTILRIYNYYTHKDTSLLVNCHFLISLISVILLKGLDPARIVVRVRNHDHLKNQLQLKEEGEGMGMATQLGTHQRLCLLQHLVCIRCPMSETKWLSPHSYYYKATELYLLFNIHSRR